MTREQRLVIWTAVAVLGSFILPTAVSVASDRTGSDWELKVGPKTPLIEKSYPPLVGNDAAIAVSPEDCMTLTHCDTVRLTLDIPASALYLVSFTMSWPGSQGNDVDLYLWQRTHKYESDDDGRTTHTSQDEIIGGAATGGHPERGKIADESPTIFTSENKPLIEYFFTPDNYTGVNAGYTLTVQYIEQEIPDLSEFDFEFVGRARERTRDPNPFRPSDSKPPQPTLSPVKVPGETGALKDFGLVALKGEQREADRQPPTILIVGTLGLVGLALLLGGFFVLRARRRTSG